MISRKTLGIVAQAAALLAGSAIAAGATFSTALASLPNRINELRQFGVYASAQNLNKGETLEGTAKSD